MEGLTSFYSALSSLSVDCFLEMKINVERNVIWTEDLVWHTFLHILTVNSHVERKHVGALMGKNIIQWTLQI